MPHKETGEGLRGLARRAVEDAPVGVLERIIDLLSKGAELGAEEVTAGPAGAFAELGAGGIAFAQGAASHFGLDHSGDDQGEEDTAEGGTSRPERTPEQRTVDAAEILVGAGVNEETARQLAQNPSTADLVLRNPGIANALAQRYPATHLIGYHEMERSLGVGLETRTDITGTPNTRQSVDAITTNAERDAEPFISPDTGAVRHPNGVLVDMEARKVFFPPNAPEVVGSPAWLLKARNWKRSKVEKWRETLEKTGYVESAKGGVDVEFLEGLRNYHESRYLYGGGKPVDLRSREARVTKEAFGALLDPDILEEEARTAIRLAYEDPDPPDEEVKYWANVIEKNALRLARKSGYEPQEAAAAARSKFAQQFRESPDFQASLDSEEFHGENTRLRESFLSIAQIVGA